MLERMIRRVFVEDKNMENSQKYIKLLENLIKTQ